MLYGKWTARVKLIVHLYALITFSLFYSKYYGANRYLSTKIIIYRGGDGDSGDIDRLTGIEMSAVKVGYLSFAFH